MLWLLLIPLRALLALRRSHRDLALENLALRHQLRVALRTNPRPRLRRADRIFWVWLRRLWPGGWSQHVSVVRPETVIGWHRKGWRLLLDLAVAQPPRSAPASTRGPRADRQYVAGQPSVGNRADPRRAAQAWHRRQQPLHPALSLARSRPAVERTELARIPDQPAPRHLAADLFVVQTIGFKTRQVCCIYATV
jgi:hypothetical protein